MEITLLSNDPSWVFAKGGEDSLVVSSSEPWKVSCNSDWLTLSTSEGCSGESLLRVATRPNTGESSRIAKLQFRVGSGLLEYELTQFPDIFNHHSYVRLKVRSSLVISYDATTISRVYSVIPVPHSDQYQTITNVSLFDGASADVCVATAITCMRCPISARTYPRADGRSTLVSLMLSLSWL